MSVFANRWRDWATLDIGLYLVFSPWIFGASADESSFANAWIAGLSAIMVAAWSLVEPGSQARQVTRIGVGTWLLISPFLLGFTTSYMAYNVWITGVIVLALTPILNLSFELQSWLRSKKLGSRVSEISPQQVMMAATPEEHTLNTDRLSRQIAERSYQIYRALQSRPSDVEVEMCAIGYRACAEDMITLAHLIDKELSEAGLARQLHLKKVRDQAAHSLSRVRRALPQELRHCSVHSNGVT